MAFLTWLTPFRFIILSAGFCGVVGAVYLFQELISDLLKNVARDAGDVALYGIYHNARVNPRRPPQYATQIKPFVESLKKEDTYLYNLTKAYQTARSHRKLWIGLAGFLVLAATVLRGMGA